MPNDTVRDLSTDLDWQSDNLILGAGNVAFGVVMLIAWALSSLGMISAWPAPSAGKIDWLLVAAVWMVPFGTFVVARSRRRVRALSERR